MKIVKFFLGFSLLLSSFFAYSMHPQVITIEERLGGFRESDNIEKIAILLNIGDGFALDNDRLPEDFVNSSHGQTNIYFRSTKNLIARIIGCNYHAVPKFNTSQFVVKTSNSETIGFYIISLEQVSSVSGNYSKVSRVQLEGMLAQSTRPNMKALKQMVDTHSLDVLLNHQRIRQNLLGDCSICI